MPPELPVRHYLSENDAGFNRIGRVDVTAMKLLDGESPVLIAGPTASGKSALALDIAKRFGGVIVNADALQVYANWRILTARPSAEEEIQAPHNLYGHVAPDQDYSVGHWLREVTEILRGEHRPIIVGGTGLYFTALTEGLAEIPAVPAEVRAMGDNRDTRSMLAELDPETRARIDQANRARVQRAWEVQAATGRGLAAWQALTPPPTLPLDSCVPLVVDAPKDELTPRIERRFDTMLEAGALAEVETNLDGWDPTRPSARAIGAPELVAYLRGELSLDAARDAATIATRQYAKRQRTWFRARMKGWNRVPLGTRLPE